MYLTNAEEHILDGDAGVAKQKAMQILTTLGTIYKADKLIPITSAQISGVSYKNIGDAGIQFLKNFENARVSVKTTLNPISFDIEHPKYLNLDSTYIAKQLEILQLYKSMGVLGTYTCTPYYYENVPAFGEHVAWAESSAIAYINSVLGARSNRESGVSALAAALIGKTPDYGLHIKNNRRATIRIMLKFVPALSDFAVLGLIIGEKIKTGIPYISGVKEYTYDALKAMSAALNATGSIPMFHVELITPEWKMEIKDLEKITIEYDEVKAMREKFTIPKNPELVALGCPHLSYNELREIARFLKGKKKKQDVELWLFTSRSTKQRGYEYVQKIEKFGGKVYADTCMVVAPLDRKFNVTATNSGKAAFYLRLPRYANQDTAFYDLYTLLEMVCV